MEAILAQGFRGMGEWMGIGRAGTGSTDIVAVIACHAIKSWRVHWSILHCCTKILQWTLHDLIAWRTTATILMLPLCSLHYYCCRLYVLRFVATLQFVSTLRFLSTINVSTLRFTVRIRFVCMKYANDPGLGYNSPEVSGATRATCSFPIYWLL